MALGVGIGLVDGHVVGKQAVTADVPEMRQILRHGKLLLIFLLQRQAYAAGAYAEGGVIGKGSGASGLNADGE